MSIYILSSEPEYQGFTGNTRWSKPCPEPLPCEFCGKPRYFIGQAITDADDNVINAFWPDRDEKFAMSCTCAKGMQHYRMRQVVRLHALHLEKRQKQIDLAATFQQHSQFQTALTSQEGPKIIKDADNQVAIDTIDSFYVHYEYLYKLPPACKIPKGLFLYGNSGTGKTTMVTILARALQKNDIPVLILSGIELLNLVMEEIKGQSKLTRSLDFLKTVEVLIIDDIDKIAATPWAINTLYELIDARSTAYLSTIFTTNRSLAEFPKLLGKNPQTDKTTIAAIVDRIAGMTYPLYFGGKSWRQK